jgi:carbon storage regulator
MLILARRPNESLVIDNNITLTVLAIKGNQVRLGITAPRDVVIDREEVHQRKLAEYRTSAARHFADPNATISTPAPSAVRSGGESESRL